MTRYQLCLTVADLSPAHRSVSGGNKKAKPCGGKIGAAHPPRATGKCTRCVCSPKCAVESLRVTFPSPDGAERGVTEAGIPLSSESITGRRAGAQIGVSGYSRVDGGTFFCAWKADVTKPLTSTIVLCCRMCVCAQILSGSRHDGPISAWPSLPSSRLSTRSKVTPTSNGFPAQ